MDSYILKTKDELKEAIEFWKTNREETEEILMVIYQLGILF